MPFPNGIEEDFDFKNTRMQYNDSGIQNDDALQTYQGPTSPTVPGRSVREYEDQMTTLRKENFNLKLRLYFLEESIPGYLKRASDSAEDKKSLKKQMIDTKVELEMLRKEVQDKQELLNEASRALSQMQMQANETEAKYRDIVDDLKQQIFYYEMEHGAEKYQCDQMNDLLEQPNEAGSAQNFNFGGLEPLLKKSADELNVLKLQNENLCETLTKRNQTIKEYEEKLKEIVFENSELEESLEQKELESSALERSIKALRSTNTQLKAENNLLINKIKSVEDKFHTDIAIMKQYEKQMQEQQNSLAKIEDTLSLKTANTARLLECIEDYEKMVNQINQERKVVNCENHFFRRIINRLKAGAELNDEHTEQQNRLAKFHQNELTLFDAFKNDHTRNSEQLCCKVQVSNACTSCSNSSSSVSFHSCNCKYCCEFIGNQQRQHNYGYTSEIPIHYTALSSDPLESSITRNISSSSILVFATNEKSSNHIRSQNNPKSIYSKFENFS